MDPSGRPEKPAHGDPARQRVLTALRSAAEYGSPLTRRERIILALIGQGKVVKEMATELNLSPGTIGNHRKSICRKLALHSTAELVQFATLWLLVFQDSIF